MRIPQLETERLILRNFCEKDFDTYQRFCADAEVMQFLGEGKPLAAFEAWRQIAFIIGHWQLRGYGMWALAEKATDQLVGRLGFLNPHGWPGFEIGWMLGREHWGKGFATEAATRALQFAREELAEKHVISLIVPENLPSIKVAERLGEKLEGETVVFNHRVLIYGRDI